MLQHCTEELERIAPDDPELPRAIRALSPQCPPWRFWGGWLAIAVAAAVTSNPRASAGPPALPGAGHRRCRGFRVAGRVRSRACRRVAARRTPSTGWLSKRPVDDQHPEDGIPTEKREERRSSRVRILAAGRRARRRERADKRGDHAAALRFYATLAKAVPDRAVAYSKMCNEYEALGDVEKATSACGDALLRDGVRLGDYTHFVRLIVGKPGKLNEKEVAALGNVIQHMRDDPQGQGTVDEIECEVGVRTSNVAQLRECTTALLARAPNDPKTVTYQWALAVQEGEFDDADELVERASTLGVHVEAMRQATAAGEKQHRMTLFVIFASALLVAVAALAGGAALRRRLSPNPA